MQPIDILGTSSSLNFRLNIPMGGERTGFMVSDFSTVKHSDVKWLFKLVSWK